MANVYGINVLKDDTQHAVIKLTARFDGTGQESNTVRIQANTLYGAMDTSKGNLLSSTANTGALDFYGLSVYRLWYDCASGGDVTLYWNAATPLPIFVMNGNGEYDSAGNWVTIPNNLVPKNFPNKNHLEI